MEARIQAALPRQRLYTAVEPHCEWSRTDDCDTLTVDVSGFKKEELKVLVNTCGKLKVTGEHHVDGAQWARFFREFRVPKGCDISAIRAKMDKVDALLYVILPKGASPAKEQKAQPDATQKPPSSADSSSGGSSGGYASAKEEAGRNRLEEKQESQHEMAPQDVPKTDDPNAAKTVDEVNNKKWWTKIRPLHVLGLVLFLAVVGVGLCVLYVMLL